MLLPDLDQVRAFVAALEAAPAAQRLDMLERAAIEAGGVCHLPKEAPRPGVHPFSPVLASLEVFGIFAMSDDAAEIPDNWLRVARNVLAAMDEFDPPARVA